MGSSKVLRALMLSLGLLLTIGVAVQVYLHDRDSRITAVKNICYELGGHYSTDLVDGNYVLDFTGADVTNQNFADVMHLAKDLPASITLDYSGEIWLTLANTKVDNVGMQYLIPQITFLDLRGLDITKEGVESIVERTPRLFSLILAETTIDDDAIRVLARRPPQLVLDLSQTSITPEGLRPLSGAHCTVNVKGTGITREDLVTRDINVDIYE